MPGLSISKLVACLRPSKLAGARIHNLTDGPIELQIRAGSVVKRVHLLKPGSSKRLDASTILKLAYLPSGCDDELCYEDREPYVVIHDDTGGARVAKQQQYISLEDLRGCSEIRVYRDHQRGCISVRKKKLTPAPT